MTLKRTLALFGTSALALSLTGCGGTEEETTIAKRDVEAAAPISKSGAMKASAAPSVTVPAYASNFRLFDHQGGALDLFYHTDAPAIVIMTQENGSDAADKAMPKLHALRDQYADDGILFFGLNSSLKDDRAAIREVADAQGWDIPILDDRTQLVGEQFGVTRAAEVFILDPEAGFKIVYHGPLDGEEAYTANTLDQILADEEVTVTASTSAVGNVIDFPERMASAAHQNISYVDDIAPVLLESCVDCHQPGGIGPWAMTDYDAVRGWSPMIREVLMTRRMPPWQADPEVNEFAHDPSLTPEEIKTVVHWVNAGSPRGDGEDPLAMAELGAPEWPASLGEPDLILTAPEYRVAATGVIEYQHPMAANPLTEDKWLRATSIKPGSRETVHHALSGYMENVPEDGQGFTSRWKFSTGTYAVGEEANYHPDNSGTPFPAGGAVGFQMHYTPIGKEVDDQTRIGFYFHDEKPKYYTRSYVIADFSIEIPAGEGRHKEVAHVTWPADAILYKAFPHAHYRGYSSTLEILHPDGRQETILSVPRYDFNWQHDYEFAQPIEIKAGTRMISTYVYDNSELNFANPDASATITWGDQTFEEMHYTRLTYQWVGETTDNLMEETQAEMDAQRLLGAVDDDYSGTVELAELRGAFGSMMKGFFPVLDANKDGSLDLEEMGRAQEMMFRQRGNQRTDAGDTAPSTTGE